MATNAPLAAHYVDMAQLAFGGILANRHGVERLLCTRAWAAAWRFHMVHGRRRKRGGCGWGEHNVDGRTGVLHMSVNACPGGMGVVIGEEEAIWYVACMRLWRRDSFLVSYSSSLSAGINHAACCCGISTYTYCRGGKADERAIR